MHKDVFGQALLDYFHGDHRARVHITSSLGDREALPVSYYFRGLRQMPPLERLALDHSRGAVLDIGCGAGSHGLWLSSGGFDYTGLDLSEGAVKVCTLRGLERVLQGDIWEFEEGRYDTILLLMNGLGLAGGAERLPEFVRRLLGLLRDGGQILGESTDLNYLFDLIPGLEGRSTTGPDYYGNLTYEWRYRGRKGVPFPWLFAGEPLLSEAVAGNGARLEILGRNKESGFLARITA